MFTHRLTAIAIVVTGILLVGTAVVGWQLWRTTDEPGPPSPPTNVPPVAQPDAPVEQEPTSPVTPEPTPPSQVLLPLLDAGEQGEHWTVVWAPVIDAAGIEATSGQDSTRLSIVLDGPEGGLAWLDHLAEFGLLIEVDAGVREALERASARQEADDDTGASGDPTADADQGAAIHGPVTVLVSHGVTADGWMTVNGPTVTVELEVTRE